MIIQPEQNPALPKRQRLILDYMRTITELSASLANDSIGRVMAEQMARLLEGDTCLLVERPDCPAEGDAAAAAMKIAWAHVSQAGSLAQWIEESIAAADCPFLARCIEDPLAYHTALDEEALNPTDRAFFARFRAHHIVAAPVFLQDRFFSLMVITSSRPEPAFDDQDVLLAHVMATQTGAFLHVAKMNQDLAEHSRNMEFLYQSSLSLTASLDLNDVLEAILRCSFGVAGEARDAHIFLYDGQKLSFGTSLWADGSTGKMWAEPRPDGMTYAVARSGEMVFIPNMKNHLLYRTAPADWHGAILGLPLKIGQRVVGVMTMAFEESRLIHESELRMFRLLGDQAAISIENARLHNIINQQAHTDALTALPNRRFFDERLVEEVRRSSRYQHPFTLVVLDIDRFKRINDTFGHPAGDEALKQVAASLRQNTRDTDFVARYGGDEFVMIFPETGGETAHGLVERIREQAAALVPVYSSDPHERYSLSAGLATFPQDAAGAAELLSAADRALYNHKHRKI